MLEGLLRARTSCLIPGSVHGGNQVTGALPVSVSGAFVAAGGDAIAARAAKGAAGFWRLGRHCPIFLQPASIGWMWLKKATDGVTQVLIHVSTYVGYRFLSHS